MNLNFMKLREQMENQKVSYYLVPSEDPHQSEYVDDYFKCRQYISGFTGSAGTFLAGCEEGWLWTDGRYFTQAEGQISSDITLMKQGVSGVPTILEFLKEHLQEGDTLGVNGFTISASYGKKIAKLVKQHGASFRFDLRFVEEEAKTYFVDKVEKMIAPRSQNPQFTVMISNTVENILIQNWHVSEKK